MASAQQAAHQRTCSSPTSSAALSGSDPAMSRRHSARASRSASPGDAPGGAYPAHGSQVVGLARTSGREAERCRAGQAALHRRVLLPRLLLTDHRRPQLWVCAPATGVPQTAQQAQAGSLQHLGCTCRRDRGVQQESALRPDCRPLTVL